MFMFQFLWTFLLFFLTVFSFEEGRQLSGSVYELIYSENGKSLTIVYNSTPAISWGIADACSQTWQQRIWHFGCMTIILAIQSEKNISLPPSHNHQVRDGANVHFLTGSVALQIAVVCMKDASLSATLQAFVKLWKIQHKLLQQVGIFHVNYRWPKQSQRVFWCSTIVTGDCN